MLWTCLAVAESEPTWNGWLLAVLLGSGVTLIPSALVAYLTAKWTAKRNLAREIRQEKRATYRDILSAVHEAAIWHADAAVHLKRGAIPTDMASWREEQKTRMFAIMRIGTILGPILLGNEAVRRLWAFRDDATSAFAECNAAIAEETEVTGLAIQAFTDYVDHQTTALFDLITDLQAIAQRELGLSSGSESPFRRLWRELKTPGAPSSREKD